MLFKELVCYQANQPVIADRRMRAAQRPKPAIAIARIAQWQARPGSTCIHGNQRAIGCAICHNCWQLKIKDLFVFRRPF